MPLSDEILRQVRRLTPHGKLQIISFDDELLSADYANELRLYDGKISAAQEGNFRKKLEEIKKNIDWLEILEDKMRSELDEFDLDDIEHLPEEVISSLAEIRHELRKLAKSSLVMLAPDGSTISSLELKSPPWIMQMQFAGASTILADPKSFKYRLSSQTTRQIILEKREWEKRNFPADANMVIGIVNCPVTDLGTMQVSEVTLQRASSNDIEVFDSLHELERMYGAGSFKLGMIEMSEDDGSVKNNYALPELMLRHCLEIKKEKQKKGESFSSVGIYIVSESTNLVKYGQPVTQNILDNIPFAELRAMGVQELDLEFISCNTLDIADDIIAKVDALSQKYNFRIRTHFYGGYVHNNNTFCYIDENEYTAVKATLEAGGTRIAQSLFNEENKFKKSRLMQVVLPCFSLIESRHTRELEKYICSKITQRGSPTADGTKEGVQKKFVVPHEKIPQAEAFEYEVSPVRQLSFLKLDAAGQHYEVHLPTQIQFKDKILTSYAKKEKGGSVGGFYFDQEGKRYLVKFSDYFSTQNPITLGAARFSALYDYYEIFLNRLSREILGETYSSKQTEIGYYSADAQGTRATCFVSELVPGYRDIADLSPEEKKAARPKFHDSYAFNCFIGNSDIYDENVGIDVEGNPLNVDLGLKPPFLFPEQMTAGHNAIVDQLTSFISHQNYLGGQKFRRQYFGYDEQVDVFKREEKRKANDIDYYSVLVGVRNILQKKDQILEITDQMIAEILNDEAIPLANRENLQQDFSVIKQAFIDRMQYLEHHFGADVARLEATPLKFKSIKWRQHSTYQEILAQSREFEQQMAQTAYNQGLVQLAEILQIPVDENLRTKILEIDPKQLADEQKEQLQKAIKTNFILHCAVMNIDLKMAEWLLDNDLADIKQRYTQRNHNYHFCPETPLSIAVGMHNDKLLYDDDKAAMKPMIALLAERFFDERKNSDVNKPEYENDTQNIWPLRMTKMVYKQYEKDQNELENKSALILQDIIRQKHPQLFPNASPIRVGRPRRISRSSASAEQF